MLGSSVRWIRSRGNYSDHVRLQHCIRGRGGGTAQPRQKKQMKVQVTFCTWVLGFCAWLGIRLNSMSLSLFWLKRLHWLRLLIRIVSCRPLALSPHQVLGGSGKSSREGSSGDAQASFSSSASVFAPVGTERLFHTVLQHGWLLLRTSKRAWLVISVCVAVANLLSGASCNPGRSAFIDSSKIAFSCCFCYKKAFAEVSRILKTSFFACKT